MLVLFISKLPDKTKCELNVSFLILGAFLLPSAVCGVAFLINFIAIYYHASRAIPFTVMVFNNFVSS